MSPFRRWKKRHWHGGMHHGAAKHSSPIGAVDEGACLPQRPRRFYQQFFWRVYLHSVFLLVVVASTVAVLSLPFRNPPPFASLPERLANYLQAEAEGSPDPYEKVKQELERINRIILISYSIYDPNGQLKAANISPPIPALPSNWEEGTSGQGTRGRRVWSQHPSPFRPASTFQLELLLSQADQSPMAQVVLEVPGISSLSTVPAILRMLAVLVALGVASVPLVRMIVRPLERLAETTVAFGEGDLSARTGMTSHDEAGLLARAFDQMADRIQALIRGERELIANVSHELRTPLARIRVALELAEDDPAEATRYLSEIKTDLNELEGLLEDVLITARLDLARGRTPNGAPPLHRVDVPALTVLSAAAERFHAAWPERTLEVQFEQPLPNIEADMVLLRRVFDNLLDNARKYADPAHPIRFAARADGTRLVVSVEDRGAGIAAEDLPHLFTPFFRTDRSRQRETGGVGLGLALVKRVVETHGGTVTVSSQPGQGTVFTVFLKCSGISV